jgi:hypothetical protein
MLIKVNERRAEHGVELVRRSERRVSTGGIARNGRPAEGTT